MADLNPWSHALSLHRSRRETGPRAWRRRARPEQVPPKGWRRTWYVRGGRFGGKTWTGSNAFAELIRTYPHTLDPDTAEQVPTEWGVIAPTFADARDTCIENRRSGLLRALGLPRNYAGWNRSQGQLRLDTGQVIFISGADDGALRIQGKNLSGAWCDEVGLWKKWKTAWRESIAFAVRISPGLIIATGTPKRAMPARELIRALLADPKVVHSLLRSVDNAANVDANALEELLELRGTALGQQELDGELLDEVEGARWSAELIAEMRWVEDDKHPVPELDRVVVAVDPAVTSKERSDHTGIVVAGRGRIVKDGLTHGFTLHSQRIKGRPEQVMRRVLELAEWYDVDEVIFEQNNGGDYLPFALHTVAAEMGVTVKDRLVHAAGKKLLRAEGLATLCEAGRWHHVGHHHEALENEQVTYTGDEADPSPDVMDAEVWAQEALIPVEAARARRKRREAKLVA